MVKKLNILKKNLALRVNWNYIKMMALLGVVIGLVAFATVRNEMRKVSEFDIQFVGENNLFVTHETVSKLLIKYS